MCEYQLTFPDDLKCHCMAYSKSVRADGLHWSNYPLCNGKDCPLVHPELLEGAAIGGGGDG